MPGDKLPSARDLATQASINPNTVVNAFAELEKRGLTEKRRGLGTFVREDANIQDLKMNLLTDINENYLSQLSDLGIDPELAIKHLQEKSHK